MLTGLVLFASTRASLSRHSLCDEVFEFEFDFDVDVNSVDLTDSVEQ